MTPFLKQTPKNKNLTFSADYKLNSLLFPVVLRISAVILVKVFKFPVELLREPLHKYPGGSCSRPRLLRSNKYNCKFRFLHCYCAT